MTDRASGSLPPHDPLYAPGLKRRARANGCALYWIPPAKDVKAGYPLKSMTIAAGTPELDAAAMCRGWWAELEAWRAGKPEGPERYTIGWLVQRYLTDDASPYQGLRFRSQKNYLLNCREIEATLGKRRIDPVSHGAMWQPRIVGEDVWRWHKNWSTRDGKPTPGRARHLIVQFRSLISYAVTLGVPGARDLQAILSTMRFPTTPPRDVAPTWAQVMAVVDQAMKDGYLSVAITTLAQFELIERRTHIIGYWEGDQWRPGWVWSGITKDWVITYFQTKRGRVLREFDLKRVPRLLELLQMVPEENRIGPVILCERTRLTHLRLPWKERHYMSVWRTIARRAGVPDEVWSMDMRAGGATEADAIPEVTDRQLKDAGGWSNETTRDRYRRSKPRNAGIVIDLRQKARKE